VLAREIPKLKVGQVETKGAPSSATLIAAVGEPSIEKNDPDAPTIARGILATFEQIVVSMRNQQLRDDNGQAIGKRLEEALGGLISFL
jgi:3-methyladenine DNA glycosylase/8-oxoguanine DNA glycosylase